MPPLWRGHTVCGCWIWVFTAPWLQAPAVMSGCQSPSCFPHANRKDEEKRGGTNAGHRRLQQSQFSHREPVSQNMASDKTESLTAKQGDAWLDCDCKLLMTGSPLFFFFFFECKLLKLVAFCVWELNSFLQKKKNQMQRSFFFICA